MSYWDTPPVDRHQIVLFAPTLIRLNQVSIDGTKVLAHPGAPGLQHRTDNGC